MGEAGRKLDNKECVKKMFVEVRRGKCNIDWARASQILNMILYDRPLLEGLNFERRET